MSNTVPSGWSVHELGDLAHKIEGGGTPSRTEASFWNGGIPWATVKDLRAVSLRSTEEHITELGLKNSSSKLIPANTIIIATRMAVGKAVYFDRDVAINQDLKAFHPKGGTNWRFLLQWYLSKSEKIENLATGSTVKGIRLDELKLLPIDLPPLPEQQKIAAILSAVDDVIEKTCAQIDKLKDLKTGMMQELLTKGIGPGGAPHTEFKDSPLGQIPISWDVYSLTELSTFRRGSFPQPYGLPEWYSDSGYPFVQVFDIGNNGRLKPSTKVRITDAAASKSVFVPKGSVAVSIQGSIGRVAITQYDAYFDRTILIFTKLNKNVDRGYFALMIGEIFRVKKDSADGGVIKTITKETLKDFLLKLPPIGEQRTISKTLDEIDRNARLKIGKLSKLQAVKKALMQDLLTGKVRVKVDQKESAVA